VQTGLPGGRKGYRETLKTRAFGVTLPSCGILAALWILVLSVPDVRGHHGISTVRSLGATIPAMVIPLLILVLPDILIYCISETGPLPVAGSCILPFCFCSIRQLIYNTIDSAEDHNGGR